MTKDEVNALEGLGFKWNPKTKVLSCTRCKAQWSHTVRNVAIATRLYLLNHSRGHKATK